MTSTEDPTEALRRALERQGAGDDTGNREGSISNED